MDDAEFRKRFGYHAPTGVPVVKLGRIGDAVIVRVHPYGRHPNSGAGNCWCGRPLTSRLHL